MWICFFKEMKNPLKMRVLAGFGVRSQGLTLSQTLTEENLI